MTTDFRALCTELVDIITAHANPDDYAVGYVAGVLTSARAALADEPAVPEGREPVAVTGQPSDEDLLGIACQSIKPYDKIRPGEYEAETECVIEVYGSELVTLARAVLTRWGNLAPQPPAKGEVAELAEFLRACAGDHYGLGHHQFTRAADLLQRLSPPQPVPEAE